LDQFALFSALQKISIAYARTNCETGTALVTPLSRPNLYQAHWNPIVIGAHQEISLQHDAEGNYFCGGTENVPLIQVHMHPSGHLGFSRGDCIAASQMAREFARKLRIINRHYKPLFGVGVLPRANTIECLLVQRKKPGTFMQFHEIQYTYLADSWLSCPAFNAAHIRWTKEFKGGEWKMDILEDSGITFPLT